jgi:hypothetical protein
VILSDPGAPADFGVCDFDKDPDPVPGHATDDPAIRAVNALGLLTEVQTAIDRLRDQ